MNIVIDGIIFENQQHGGVSRIYSEILPRMCELHPLLDINLITSGPVRHNLPKHNQIRYSRVKDFHDFIPNRYFPIVKRNVRSIKFNREISKANNNTIWHSTYFTLPFNWPGINILTIPDMIPELFTPSRNYFALKQFRKYRKTCVEKADAIICISHSTLSDVRNFYDLDSYKKLFTIHLAASEVFQQSTQISGPYLRPTSKEFFLYVGGRQYYKNFQQLLKAYASWEKRHEIDLVVVGGAWSRTELSTLNALNIEEKVHLFNQLNDEELARLYTLALAFIYPSIYEGFGIPLVEAMCCGCPIVASKIPSTLEVAGNCPIYFDPTDLDAMIDAMRIAAEESKNENRINLGLDISKKYSWDQCAKETLKVYTDYLSKK